MQNKFSLFLCCLLILLGFSCRKESSPPDDAGASFTSVLSRIRAAGFSTEGVQRIDSGYLVERDILLYEKDLVVLPENVVLRVAETEQYSTRELVRNLPRTLRVRAAGLPQPYVQAVQQAIANYNALGLALTFTYVASGTVDITVNGTCMGTGLRGTSGFPANGNPYPTITLNTCSPELSNNTDFIRHVIEHEIGHSIGLRHTDWFSSVSCGGAAVNEGAGTIGALPIPGTPSGFDEGSFMLKCYSLGVTGDPGGSFNANDRIAMEGLYAPFRETPCNSSPVAISRDVNNMSVFAIGPSSNLIHKSWNNTGKWARWQILGPINSLPAAVSRSVNFMDVFAKGASGNLVHLPWTSARGWGKWIDLQGSVEGAPAAVSRAPGVITVFARSAANRLVSRTWINGSGWQAWEDLGGNIISDPAAVSRDANNIFVFAQTAGNTLAHISWSAGTGWSAWSNLGGAIDGVPAADSRIPQVVNVFAKSTTGTLTTISWSESGGWSAWSNLGGVLSSAPAAVSRDAGNLQVFAVSGTAIVSYNWTTPGSWTSGNIGGPVNSMPAVTSRSADYVNVFARSGTEVHMISWTNGTGWTTWGGI
ncbi:hypothetical protein ECE50_030450 (plasmid) [Chitinophaga sp. Mgbs1]|uniref:PLL-like beta propeller domain-containing protein n=1 Tax=Chitinophaga solisilvae TaxID=1233460 RepID=A0A433WM09_9BACT|nr:hypothetical protein [Chitinophaga solisilvae]